jgi:hypothetical protein
MHSGLYILFSVRLKNNKKMTYYQIKSFRITWVGKRYRSAKLAALGKAYNGRMNTQTAALITRRETTPFDRYDVTDSPQRM